MAIARLRRNVSHNNPTIAVNGRPLFIVNNNRNIPNMDQKNIGEFRRALPQFLAVSIKNILLFVYGMTLGFPTIVIPAIQGGDGREPSDIVLNREEISWFSSINLICVPLGCLFSGLLTQPIGKRRAMQFVNLPILASWLLFHFATKTEHLYAALCFSGLGGGLMEAPVLTYVAEITEPKYRGILSALGSTCVMTGVFIQFIMGSLMDWRTVAAVSSAFPVISIIALCFVPESPTWLIREQRYKEAVKALQWLRGWVPEYKIEAEFNQLYDELITQPALEEAEEAEEKPSKCKHYMRMCRKRSVLVPFILVAFTFFTGHFSGKTSLQTYAVQIFHTLKAPINKYHATILLGVAEMIATVMCVFLIHFTGKRPLVLISTFGVGVCFFATATYAHYLKIVPGFAINNVVVNASSIVPKEDIISQRNITDIFISEQNVLLHAGENQSIFMNMKNFENIETTVLPTIYAEDSSYFDNSLNRSLRDIQLLFDAGNTSRTDYDDPINLWNTTALDYVELNDTDAYSETNITTKMQLPGSKELILNAETVPVSHKNNISNDIEEHQAADSGLISADKIGHDLLLKVPKQEENYLVWLPLILLLGAAFFAHFGIRMIPWILIGEVFPAQVRSTASGSVSAVGYIFGFLANKLFLQMLSALTLPGTFWFYSAVAFFGTMVLYFALPETEGRSLSEIEAHFSKKSTFSLMTKTSKSGKTHKPCIQLDNLNNLHTPIESNNKAKIMQLQKSNVQTNSPSLGKVNTAYEENNTTYL